MSQIKQVNTFLSLGNALNILLMSENFSVSVGHVNNISVTKQTKEAYRSLQFYLGKSSSKFKNMELTLKVLLERMNKDNKYSSFERICSLFIFYYSDQHISSVFISCFKKYFSSLTLPDKKTLSCIRILSSIVDSSFRQKFYYSSNLFYDQVIKFHPKEEEDSNGMPILPHPLSFISWIAFTAFKFTGIVQNNTNQNSQNFFIEEKNPTLLNIISVDCVLLSVHFLSLLSLNLPFTNISPKNKIILQNLIKIWIFRFLPFISSIFSALHQWNHNNRPFFDSYIK